MRMFTLEETAATAGGEHVLQDVWVIGRRINEALYDAYAYNGPPAESVGNDSSGGSEQPDEANMARAGWIIIGYFIEKILGAFGAELVSKATEREKTGLLDPSKILTANGKPVIDTIQDGFGKPIKVVHATDGTFWLDLDRDGRYESNFKYVHGTLYVNNANNGSFWVPCHRSDWLDCGD